MIKKIRRWWKRGKVLERPESVETIAAGRLAEMFLHVPGTPGWRATLAELDLETQESVERVLDEKLSNEQMRHRIGAVEGLLAFKQRLLEREQEARARQREREESTKEQEAEGQ